MPSKLPNHYSAYLRGLYSPIIGFSLLLFAESAVSQPRAPDSPPNALAHRIEVAPVIDGHVRDDPAWNRVEPVTGFWQTQPNEGQRSTQKTEVYIAYTEDTFYVAAILYDDNPEGIIVSDSRRDADLDESDSFQIIIDGFKDGQNGLVFGTNPAGIQYDGQVNNEGSGNTALGITGFNRDWDTSWEVRTKVHDQGWSVEMEIPFKSLRYSGVDEPTWGINFQRNIRRNKEEAFWSPLQRQHSLFRVSDAGSLRGLQPPAQRNLKFTPYVLGRAQRGTLIDGTDSDSEAGFDLKYSITPSLTLDATYNTDFAQVEVDEVVVNLDRFSVFLPEKRPFFLENAGQFSVGSAQEVELFFSRRIGISDNGLAIPIEGGLRLSGKVGASTNIGLLQMRSEEVAGIIPQNDDTVIRINQELPKRSSIGAIYVRRDGEDSEDRNQTFGIDGRWGIGDDLVVSGYAAKTDTNDLEERDHALQLKADYNSEKWFANIFYSEVGEDFNPELGFVARKDFRKFGGTILRRYRPAELWGLQELRPHISYRGHWGFDGKQQSGYVHLDNHFEFKTGLEIHTGVNFVHETVENSFDIIPGATVQPGEYDNREFQLVYFTNQGAPLSFDLRSTVGGFFSGDRVTVQPTIKYRIGEAFNSELSWNYNNIDLDGPEGDFDINVGLLKLAYSFSPKISLEALLQYDDRSDSTAVNFRFAWLQTANAGLYVVYNELDLKEFGVDRDRRELIVKFSYIFDVL
ncbi:MAG: DUF5916 domain-containing protein [Halioglobus sp.]